jgi:hypothetical protein
MGKFLIGLLVTVTFSGDLFAKSISLIECKKADGNTVVFIETSDACVSVEQIAKGDLKTNKLGKSSCAGFAGAYEDPSIGKGCKKREI